MALTMRSGTAGQEKAKTVAPATIAELEERIREVLRETKAPGVGVAIVRRGGPEWIAGIGLADVAAGRPVTPDTLFRIGSVSKTFVALSILKLQREGRLRLDDTLRSKAPEIAFTNRWEKTDPVRIVHLLEHTAGFDDRALRELASNDSKPLTLAEGLAYHPASRTVRWRPGTHYSYSNPGPAVAAYIAEKVGNTRFEDYVTRHWFKPLGMSAANYFLCSRTERLLSKLYLADGVSEVAYWHNIHRPSGAVNASVHDMANLVRFFLNRGRFGGRVLLPAEDIERMERPESSLAAREGLRFYGLCNYTSVKDGFVYHGHNGGMLGAHSELAYMPEAGIGYVFMVNSDSEAATNRIDALIHAYITRTMSKPVLPQASYGTPGKIAREYSGWYEPINTRNEFLRFVERIMGLTHVRAEGGRMILWSLPGVSRAYVAQGERLYRSDDEPIPSLVLARDRSEGTLVLTTRKSLKRIPACMAWIEIGVPILMVLFALTSVILGLIWIGRMAFQGSRDMAGLRILLPPFLAVATIALICMDLISAGPYLTARLGNMTPWSAGFFAGTILFALFSVWGLVEAIRCRKAVVSRVLWWHTFVSSLLFTIVNLYLLYWGVIGMRTWA